MRAVFNKMSYLSCNVICAGLDTAVYVVWTSTIQEAAEYKATPARGCLLLHASTSHTPHPPDQCVCVCSVFLFHPLSIWFVCWNIQCIRPSHYIQIQPENKLFLAHKHTYITKEVNGAQKNTHTGCLHELFTEAVMCRTQMKIKVQ